MKLDPVVKRETAFIAAASLVCAAAVQLGFLLFGKWDMPVLLGGIIGWAMAVLNFFIMSLDVQRAVECGDEVQAKMKMRASYTWRMFAMLAVMVVSFVVDAIHWLPVVASVFYPRIVITVRQLWQRYVLRQSEEPAAYTAPAEPAEEEDDGEEEDGFEKAVGHFARRIRTDYTAAESKSDAPSEQSAPADNKNNKNEGKE